MQDIDKAALLFKAVGNLTRLKILNEINCQQSSVNEIARKLNMTQTAISHQLKVLKSRNLIKGFRKGKHIYYSLSDNHVQMIIDQVYKHVGHK